MVQAGLSIALDNSEFIPHLSSNGENTETYLLATAESEAYGKYDLLTTVLHEMAHLYGFIDGYVGFDTLIDSERMNNNFTISLDGSHLDKEAHPNDLMNTHLAPGVRKLPSELNVELLQAILAEPLPNPLLVGEGTNGNALSANLEQLSSDPLLAAIINGDFSIGDINSDDFGWQTRGAATVLEEQALLTEESPFLSNITQTFTIPESAKTLHHLHEHRS